MTNAEKLTLAKHACHIRMGVIEGTHSAKCGHPGGSLDIAEVLAYLYFVEMKVDPKDPKTRSATRDLVLAALFLALAFVLPMITGHVPQIGNMLCPMHFPVLLAGFVLGGPWGLAVGFVAPLLRSVLFGMPPMYPIAIAMAFELAPYGAVAGFMYRKVQHTLPMIYATLVTSMVAGRLVWGAVRFVLAGLSGSSFPFSAFLSGAVLTAVPGIVAQLILIPLIVAALQKARLTA